MVLQVRDAASGCPRGQIEAGLVSLHGVEAKLWVSDVQVSMIKKKRGKI